MACAPEAWVGRCTPAATESMVVQRNCCERAPEDFVQMISRMELEEGPMTDDSTPSQTAQACDNGVGWQ